MQTLQSVGDMRAFAKRAKQDGKRVAFVPTSGALHAGHAGLIALAKTNADIVIVSCFANPLAFGANEKFEAYPRSPAEDAAFCAERGVDALFAPAVETLFPRGHSTYVTEETVSKPLCGISRPTHFRGVTTGLAKLLNIIRPDVLVLGQRDAQQVAVVRKMIADLFFDIDVAVGPIVRESDGLATSVRNQVLTTSQRAEAQAIHAALQRAKQMVQQGVRSADRIIAEATHLLGERRRIRVIYIATVDPITMDAVREVVPGKTLLAVAVWVDEVRLIDNVEL